MNSESAPPARNWGCDSGGRAYAMTTETMTEAEPFVETTREVIEQLVEALDHCMDAITERGLNGSPDQAEKWGLQLPLVRAESAITAAQSMLAHHTPSTAGERDNKTEMLAKLTAWLDGLGGSIHTYSLRGIALDGFEKGWSAALMQSTADHIAQNRKLVAALPVGELTNEQIDWTARSLFVEGKWSNQNFARAILAAARSQPTTEESSVVDGVQPVREPLTLEELELCRQWFNSVQDTNGGYVGNADYVLAEKLYGILKIRCPNSITSVVGGITKKGGES